MYSPGTSRTHANVHHRTAAFIAVHRSIAARMTSIPLLLINLLPLHRQSEKRRREEVAAWPRGLQWSGVFIAVHRSIAARMPSPVYAIVVLTLAVGLKFLVR